MGSMPASIFRIVALLLAVLPPSACQRGVAERPPSPEIDLVARFSEAQLSVDVGESPDLPSPPQPRIRPDKELLLVPFGTSVTFGLEVGPDTAILTDNVFGRGSATGRLEVSWQPLGKAAKRLTADLSAVPDRAVRLNTTGRQRGRLSFTSIATGIDDVEHAAMILRAPRIGSANQLPSTIPPPQPPAATPNLIIYLIDALRADHLGCYGYPPPTSPHLDTFAAEAVLFDDAQAQSSWTRPTVASLFTGLWPQLHRANDRDEVLPEEAVTLAELLRTAGYSTAAVIANGNIDIVFGLAQGFDYYKYLQQVRAGEALARSDQVNEAVSHWLDGRPSGRPFFLYIHTIDPHLPYDPPQPHRGRFAGMVTDPELGSLESINSLNSDKSRMTPEKLEELTGLYDAEIAANDTAFGALVADLKKRGLYDSSVIVVLSDHGEELFDHRGFSHGNTLFEEVLRVPLAIRFPDHRPPRRVASVVEQVDLMPTLLEYLGLEPPAAIQGQSFLSLCEPGQMTGWKDRAVAYLHLKERRGTSYLDGSWKLLLRPKSGGIQSSLYDRREDRRELVDLADQEPELAESLGALIGKLLGETGPALDSGQPVDEHDRELREQLKALGYI
jgi:arylsulfatase A-like enzyme